MVRIYNFERIMWFVIMCVLYVEVRYGNEIQKFIRFDILMYVFFVLLQLMEDGQIGVNGCFVVSYVEVFKNVCEIV